MFLYKYIRKIRGLQPVTDRRCGGWAKLMKTERLYAITVYLLNHGRTSAGELAEQFEVSLRTIQRDMDSLCLAGIPIVSSAGPGGGYEISDRFRLDRQFATPEDYSCILTALRGLVTATADRKASRALEKIASVSSNDEGGILLDFSVLREGDEALLQALQSAVLKKRVVRFTYTNNRNETRLHSVEPVAVVYRWYAWYLLAWSGARQDYCTYKLVRMQGLEITEEAFAREHEPAQAILERADRKDTRVYRKVLVRCTEAARPRVAEYLKGRVLEELPGGASLMELTVVEEEHFWFGSLLAMGDGVRVIEPEDIRRRLLDAAEKIISLYRQP